MLTVVTSGTTAALTVGVESSLSTQTPASPATYVVRVDGSSLALGESIKVIIYTKTLSGGTEQVEQAVEIEGGNVPEVYLSNPTPTDVSYRVGITQTAGTGRTIPWKLFSL